MATSAIVCCCDEEMCSQCQTVVRYAANAAQSVSLHFVAQDMAYILATGYVGTSILLAGFIIRPDMLQVKPMLWLSYVSYPRWVLCVNSYMSSMCARR